MKKKKLLIVISLALLLSGCSLPPINKNINSKTQKNPPKTILYECCHGNEERCGQHFNNRYKFCPDDYNKKCEKHGGSLKKDLNVSSGLEILSCYKSAPDAGKECASNEECLYTCDLTNGITKNLCNLIKSEENNGNTVKTYDCSTDRPGVCSLVPIDYDDNYGGHPFEFDGKSLKITYTNMF